MSSCVELLIAEHRETERLLAAIESSLLTLCEASALSLWRGVLADYQTLAEQLYRHFVLEERALYALLSQYRTMMLMDVEHDDLLALQRTFETSLYVSADNEIAEPELLPAFEAFKLRLQAHILEEEGGIFPMADDWLEPEEQQKALRVYHELQAQFEREPVTLLRRKPGFQIADTGLFQPFEKPLSYETLYEREHASVRHIRLKAGMKQALHWVGQHQCLILLSGSVLLETGENADTAQPIQVGQTVALDSRLYFAIKAEEDAHLLAFLVWPHPHYTKAPVRKN